MVVCQVSNMKHEKWAITYHDAIQNEIDYSNVFNPLNLMWFVVGPPSTAKTPLFKLGISEPFAGVERI